jgi:RNA polymerase-binding transcription factor DksA
VGHRSSPSFAEPLTWVDLAAQASSRDREGDIMSPSFAPPAPRNPFDDQLPGYRAVLEEQWRRQVATIVELSYQALTPPPETEDPPESPAESLHASSHLIAAARQQLEETEAALRRVDDGSFGLCVGCTIAITPQRLEIVPAARYCTACQARPIRR